MVLERLLELNRRVQYQIYTGTAKLRPPFFLILLAAVLLIANLFTEIPSCIIFEKNNELAFDTRSAAPAAKNYTKERVSIVLPQTLYVIYGLESSGTTFIAKTVAAALGLDQRLEGDTVESRDRRIHIQHLSLPLGPITPAKWGYETRFSKPLAIVPMYYPTGCRVQGFGRHAPGFKEVPLSCRDFMGDKVMTYPSRYFVNISSHVEWYRELGVTVQPIMVVRDPSFHFEGIMKEHCPNSRAAFQQYEVGREIMLQSLTTASPIIVSYETLMTLQQAYLDELFDKLEIQTTYKPKFMNGNLKYGTDKTSPKHIMELLKGDDYGHNRGWSRISNTGGRGTPRRRPSNATGGRGTPRRRPSNMNVSALDGSYGTPQGFKRQTPRTSTATFAQKPGTAI
jgi:hypothetical protein